MGTMTVEAPAPQNMQALAKANRVRLARAELKREVREGRLSVREAMDRPEAETMLLFDLLIEQRRWGKSRVRRFLLSLSWNDRGMLALEAKQCGSLTERQKNVIGDRLIA
jgi:hypothetical protein